MIKIYYRSIKEREINVINDFRIGSLIYVESPTEEELSLISQNTNFNLDILKEALDIYEVPRLEIDQETIYLYSRIPYEEEKLITTFPFLVALNENFILIIFLKRFSFFEEIINKDNFYTTQRTKCLFQIFSEINFIYNKVLVNINKKIRKIGFALEKIDNKDINRLVYFETILNDFLSALVPTNTALDSLLQNKILKLYEEDKDLIENLSVANNQLIELAKSNLKNIVNIREAFSTILTNNLNYIIKVFTALTVILNLPVIITGLYGMNVALPFSNNPHAFSYILLLNLFIVISLVILFVRKKWL